MGVAVAFPPERIALYVAPVPLPVAPCSTTCGSSAISGGTTTSAGGPGIVTEHIGRTGDAGGTGGIIADDMKQTLKRSSCGGAGMVAVPASGEVAMVGTLFVSHVTPRVLLVMSHEVRTLTRSRGWSIPLLT